jgi:hypothetical protein
MGVQNCSKLCDVSNGQPLIRLLLINSIKELEINNVRNNMTLDFSRILLLVFTFSHWIHFLTEPRVYRLQKNYLIRKVVWLSGSVSAFHSSKACSKLIIFITIE